MKRNSWGTIAAAIAGLGIMLPPSAFATSPTAPISDVALRSGGLLVGQVVDQQGLAKARTEVSIRQGAQEVVRTATDENGVFAAQGLRGGNYQLLTKEGSCSCRLWAADTAPPAARPAALVVCGNDVVRGQYGAGGMIDWVKAHPFITAGVVAAAIATPLAFIDDDDDDEDEGS
jgi:hypothetical protein